MVGDGPAAVCATPWIQVMDVIIDVPRLSACGPPNPGCVPGADKAPAALRDAGLHAALGRAGWLDAGCDAPPLTGAARRFYSCRDVVARREAKTMGRGFTRREREAWGGLLSTHARLDRAIDADLRQHDGITHIEFEVLLRLNWADEHRMRIQDLASTSLLTRSGMSRLVDRMVRAGLVTREEAPEDRRGAYAVLTPAGSALFEGASARHVAYVRTLFHQRLTPQEVDTLIAIWAKLDTA